MDLSAKFGGGTLLHGRHFYIYCLADKPDIRPFEPEKISVTKYPITEYQLQPIYFLAATAFRTQRRNSGRNFVLKVARCTWSHTIPRPFSVHYNPYTQSVEILDNKDHIVNLAANIKGVQPEMQDFARKGFDPEGLDKIIYDSPN
ncbi:protein henna-like [Branchiostoma floridae x Branchiostoma belcheri]